MVRLEDLRPGAVFETISGIRAVRSKYRYPDGGCECVLLASGEYGHFGGEGADVEELARRHNDVLVEELLVIEGSPDSRPDAD